MVENRIWMNMGVIWWEWLVTLIKHPQLGLWKNYYPKYQTRKVLSNLKSINSQIQIVVWDSFTERYKGLNNSYHAYYENINFLFEVVLPGDGLSQE